MGKSLVLKVYLSDKDLEVLEYSQEEISRVLATLTKRKGKVRYDLPFPGCIVVDVSEDPADSEYAITETFHAIRAVLSYINACFDIQRYTIECYNCE